jgi:hypothetical protein
MSFPKDSWNIPAKNYRAWLSASGTAPDHCCVIARNGVRLRA